MDLEVPGEEISTTESGMVTEVNWLSIKACPSMIVAPSGITISVRRLPKKHMNLSMLSSLTESQTSVDCR